MSSISVTLSNIRNSTAFVSTMTALVALAGSNAGPLGSAISERSDLSVKDTFLGFVKTESLMTFWQTLFSSVAARVSKKLLPSIHESITIIPTQFLGAFCHWITSRHQDIDTEQVRAKNKGKKSLDAPAKFYETILKKPFDLLLGLLKIGGKSGSLVKYGLGQLAIFGLGSLALSGTDNNYPGMDVHHEEPAHKNILRTLGYAIFGQFSYTASEAIRMGVKFGKGFGKHKFAKSLANTVNQVFAPGHIFSAISSAISTYFLGRFMPRTTAAVLGKFPLDIFQKVAHCRRARGRCAIMDIDGNVVPNHRFNKSKAYNKFLDACDFVFDSVRNPMITLIAKIFRPQGMSTEVFEQELRESFNMGEDALEAFRDQQLADDNGHAHRKSPSNSPLRAATATG